MPLRLPSPRRTRQAGFAGAVVALALAGSAARAQGAAPAGPAAPALAPDPFSIWTLQDENASVSGGKITDRYYVNGLRLGWTSGTESVPGFLADASRLLWGGGQNRITFDVSQSIFTPNNTAAYNPPPNDRPYAGLLLGNLGLLTDTANTRSTVTLSLGVVGPWALAEQVQNGFHDLIGQGHTNGWHYQIRNEPAGEITASRVWRVPLGGFGGVETDVLPSLQAGVGNVRVYGQGGAVVRIGQGLGSDFGVARVQPGMSGSDAFVPTRPFVWYVFAGLDGQAVGHDITLNGNTFESSRSVPLTPYVGEIEFGAALMAYGARLTFTEVLQSQEFQHQKGGLHQFGSLALSVRF